MVTSLAALARPVFFPGRVFARGTPLKQNAQHYTDDGKHRLVFEHHGVIASAALANPRQTHRFPHKFRHRVFSFTKKVS
jgi:hypothetical protein